MACSAMGIYKRYSDEFWNMPNDKLIENDLQRILKEIPIIAGLVKSVEYHCHHIVETCKCGFDNYEADNFCRDCGEELRFSSWFPEYTHYPNTTAQSEEIAKNKFAEDYGLEGGEVERLQITKYIKVMAFASIEDCQQAQKAQDEKFRGYQSMQEAKSLNPL